MASSQRPSNIYAHYAFSFEFETLSHLANSIYHAPFSRLVFSVAKWAEICK